MEKLMETNGINALKVLIGKEKERHGMMVDEPGRIRHYHYVLGLETAYDVVSNSWTLLNSKEQD